ncbi:6185_t:CDS:2 [Paraglomus occultum]|uniref:6185_t:CDS:1 n=1 Tax=Paraglomus occultum TaxID=144539 RepID=A0A9N8ZDF9_9GLOM|nr:6185_t:CDS:2 [Paraglomus occultum]
MAREKTTRKSASMSLTNFTMSEIFKLSPYNKYVKSELPKVKADNPDLDHKAAFKLVAERWKNSPENPKSPEYPKNNQTQK